MVCGVKASWPGQKGQPLRFGQVVSPSSWITQFREMGSFLICIDPPTRCQAPMGLPQVQIRGSARSRPGTPPESETPPMASSVDSAFDFTQVANGAEEKGLLMPSDLARATRRKTTSQPTAPLTRQPSYTLSPLIRRPGEICVKSTYRAMHNVTGGKAVKPFKM